MPGLNGFELAELMRGNERTRRIPIIFVTAGTADSQRRFRGYEAGAVDFIQKPIEPDVLRSKVDVFFELYRQRQQLALQRDELASQAEALAAASRQKDILLREVNHRIKNLFSVAGGLISISARTAVTVEQLQSDLRARMQALARAHELTLPDFGNDQIGDQAATTVHALLRTITAPHGHDAAEHISIHGEDTPLSGNALTSLALLLHELATNAAKYGALATPGARLDIGTSLIGDWLHMTWVEQGSPSVSQEPVREGFGSTLERAGIQSLGGQISRDWHSNGMSLLLKVPIARLSP